MPLVVFERTRDVGVLEDIEHPIIWENVKAHELVVGRGGTVRPLPCRRIIRRRVIEGFSWSIPGRGDHELLSLHFAARAILAAGVLTCAAVAREQSLLGQADMKTWSTYFL